MRRVWPLRDRGARPGMAVAQSRWWVVERTLGRWVAPGG